MGFIGILYRACKWLLKAAIAVLSLIVLLGEANNAVPSLMERGEELGLKPATDGAISFLDRSMAIVRYLVTEHFILLAILIVGCGVGHHIWVGKPVQASRIEFDRRRAKQPARNKGKKK